MTENTPHEEPAGGGIRCPDCDTLNLPGAALCLMCGKQMPLIVDTPAPPRPGIVVPQEEQAETPPSGEGQAAPSFEEPPADLPSSEISTDEPSQEHEPQTSDETLSPAEAVGASPAITFASTDNVPPASGEIIESVMIERQSMALPWMVAFFFFFLIVTGILILRNAEPVTSLALFPTLTPLPPTITLTPTWTLVPSETPPPSETPTQTPPPTPTETPRPARQHPVAAGETMFGLSLFYDISMASIAQLNGFSVEAPLQAGRVLLIPWPTATPPLVPVITELNGEPVVADPTDCQRVEIEAGDSIAGIAARHGIDFNLLMEVNRLTEQSVLRPGDTMCIPQVIYGGVLPPTPGPSPTPLPTSFPPGPAILYPPAGAIVSSPDQEIILQWVAVKDLAEDEWYMVELTNRSDIGSPTHRGFTRENFFRVPSSWRPIVEEEHEMQWQVSIVKVTARRQDGGFIYEYGGRNSEAGIFVWQGAIPTATPTPTATPSPTREPEPEP